MSMAKEAALVFILTSMVLAGVVVVDSLPKRDGFVVIESCEGAIEYTRRWFPKKALSCQVERGRWVVREKVCEGHYCKPGAVVAAFEVMP